MRTAVGLDLNYDHYDWLLDRAVAFTRAAGGKLDLVHVGEGNTKARKLAALLERVPIDVRGEARLIPGDPANELVKLTHTYDAMVVGPRDPPGLQKYFQNPMAVRVLRRAQCPVYVPRTDTFGERAPRLLVGIDLSSDRLEFMVDQAQTWARVFGGKVDLMHAMERSFPPVLRPELRATAEEEWRRTHHKNLERLTAMTDWLPSTTRGVARLEHGEADAALVDASHDYDLLLMGSRDRDTIERMLLGSVAKFVIANAQCDLLFLPTAVVPDDAEELKAPESIG